MFCSNCGKNLSPDASVCPHCGMSVGESHFDSVRGYTAAQNKLRPNEAVQVPNNYGNHYSAKFTVESDKAGRDLPSDADCGYRAVPGAGVSGYNEYDQREPLYDEDMSKEAAPSEETEVPESAPAPKWYSRLSPFKREEVPAEEDPDEDNEDDDTEEDDSLSKPIDLHPAHNSGISEDVLRQMAALRSRYESDEQKRNAKKARQSGGEKAEKPQKAARTEKPVKPVPSREEPESEDYDEEAPAVSRISLPRFSLPLDFLKRHKAEENFDDLDEVEEETDPFADTEEASDEDYSPDEDEEYEEEFDDEEIEASIQRDNRIRVAKYVIAALIAVLIGAGIFAIFSNVKNENENQAPVPEVTYELWKDGIALMNSRVTSDYQRKMLACCDAAGNGIPQLQSAYTRDQDDISNLMPANPRVNDQLFIDALKAVQGKINVCLLNDAMAFSDTSRTAAQKNQDSTKYWNEVRDLVRDLEAATTRGELESICRNASLTYTPQVTPTPSPAPSYSVSYTSLQKGSHGEDVENLQLRLKELGYLKDAADGQFGSKTRSAVEQFQQAAGLKVTGIADEETQKALFASSAPYAQ